MVTSPSAQSMLVNAEGSTAFRERFLDMEPESVISRYKLAKNTAAPATSQDREMTLPTNQPPNPAYWRARAATMRALMLCMENEETKARLAKLAARYEERADRTKTHARTRAQAVKAIKARTDRLSTPSFPAELT